jgi:hypothetical protein
MKNKGLIIGGVAIVALGAFFWMRKKNQMASEDAKMEDGLDTATGKTEAGKGDFNAPIQRTDGASVKGSGSGVTSTPAVNVIPMDLTLKPINNAVDLQGTKLSADIVLVGAGNARLAKVTQAISRLNSVGRSVLNYISDTDSLQRATPEFAKGLDAKVGVGASKDNFAERLVTYLRNNSVNWSNPNPQPFPPAPSTSSFSANGMDCENEDFAFNGHTF